MFDILQLESVTIVKVKCYPHCAIHSSRFSMNTVSAKKNNHRAISKTNIHEYAKTITRDTNANMHKNLDRWSTKMNLVTSTELCAELLSPVFPGLFVFGIVRVKLLLYFESFSAV